MGSGVVGGKLASGRAQRIAAASLASQILDGIPIDSTPTLDDERRKALEAVKNPGEPATGIPNMAHMGKRADPTSVLPHTDRI